RALARARALDGQRDPVRAGPHSTRSLAVRGAREGARQSLGNPARDPVEPGVPESGLRHREMRRPALAPPEYSHPRDPRDGVLSPGAPADPGGGSRVAARALA